MFCGINEKGPETLKTPIDTFPFLPTPCLGFIPIWPEMYSEAWNLLCGWFSIQGFIIFGFQDPTVYPYGCKAGFFFQKFSKFIKMFFLYFGLGLACWVPSGLSSYLSIFWKFQVYYPGYNYGHKIGTDVLGVKLTIFVKKLKLVFWSWK